MHMKLNRYLTNIMINQSLVEVEGENNFLHMKWRVIQITVSNVNFSLANDFRFECVLVLFA